MRRARKSMNQINVVPYIDVMLVLLVIFMVTAPLVNPGEIELPSVGSKLTAPARRSRSRCAPTSRCAARPAGRCAPRSRCRATSSSRASGRSRRSCPTSRSSSPPTSAARYEDVLGVLDLLQRNGVRKVGLLARPPAELRPSA